MQYDVIEKFAGPGGASLGIRNLGLHGLGIEWDDAACATRKAAGLPTLKADVSKVDPREYRGVEGSWDSPPCQGFSRAGLQKGHGDAGRILSHIQMVTDELEWVPFAEDGMKWSDHRSQFVLEPLRWAMLMEPRWMVWEQVPFVQLIWDACKPVLEEWGYEVWTGKLRSEQYGVPQTRERAILIASRDGVVHCPPVTHSKFYSRDPKRLDEGVLPWVSMAEALGWGMTKRPYITVAAGTSAGGQDTLMAGGSAARKVVFDAHDGGEWQEQPADHPLRVQRSNYSHGSDTCTAEDRGRGVRLMDEPSMALTGRPPQWLDIHDADDSDPTVRRALQRTGVVQAKVMGQGMVERHGDRRPRQADEPSFTITANTDGATRLRWEERPLVARAERPAALRNNTSAKAAVRPVDSPAPTMYFGARLNSMYWLTSMGDVRAKNGTIRDVDQPAGTLTASMDNGNFQWVKANDYEALMGILAGEVTCIIEDRTMIAAGLNNTARALDRDPDTDPAPTLTGKGTAYWRLHWREWTPEGIERVRDQTGTPFDPDWPFKRPATVLATRDTVQHPGTNANRFNDSKKSRNDGLRVSVEEAGVLQSFPYDYPWQGTRTKQFEQVGNAVPPLLASHAVLEAARPTRGEGWAPLPGQPAADAA